MRSIILSLAALSLAVVLSGCAAKAHHPGRKAAARKKAVAPAEAKQEKAEKQAAPKPEGKTETVKGYGETASAARANALREAQEWLERELKAEMKAGWTVPRKHLEPAYLEAMHVINVAEADKPAADPDAGGALCQRYEVTLTPQFVSNAQTAARDERVSHEKETRFGNAVSRQNLVFRILGGALAMLLVVAGYLRLEEATRGYYTTLLRVVAVSVVAMAVMALAMIR